MNKVTVGNNQTVWDILLQEYGSVEAFFQMVDSNPTVFTNLNVLLLPGMVLKVSETAFNSKVKDYYSKRGLKVVNGVKIVDGSFDEGFGNAGAFNEGFDDGFEN